MCTRHQDTALDMLKERETLYIVGYYQQAVVGLKGINLSYAPTNHSDIQVYPLLVLGMAKPSKGNYCKYLGYSFKHVKL